MKTVTMHEAKTHLSRLVKEIREGKQSEIVIAIGNIPAARLVPLPYPSRRTLGVARGQIEIAPDFDVINGQIADLFEGAKTTRRNQK